MNKGESTSAEKGNHFYRYINYSSAILKSYQGSEPLHLYLRKYFSDHKKHGSRDRKIISSLCYNYFRLGFGVSPGISVEEKFLLSAFLIEQKSSSLLQSLKPEWNAKINLSLSEKMEMLKNVLSTENIFPFNDELSNEINIERFNQSFLTQPKLYTRIRPGQQELVFEKLKAANISFEQLDDHCLVFSNNEKVSGVLSIDKDVVVQDYNSQRTEDILKEQLQLEERQISIWDCCAASGGKSILAFDLFKNIQLTVSDTRKNILQNLKLRFAKAGIKNYQSFIADLSISSPVGNISHQFGNGEKMPDLIIADVPCSGSGTWSRTPEQLSFFNKKEIKRYAELQQKIVLNAVRFLKENGFFLYITCSVFKKENEENVSFIQEKTDLQLIKTEYFKGYEIQADTLFVALFKKMPK